MTSEFTVTCVGSFAIHTRPVGVEELRTRELLFRHLWCRFCDTGKFTKVVGEAGLSSDPNRVLKIKEGTCISWLAQW